MGTTAQNMQLTRWYFFQDRAARHAGRSCCYYYRRGDLGAKRETVMQPTTLAGRKRSVTIRREQIVQFPHRDTHPVIFRTIIVTR
jgi:hypothetical protein